MHPEKKLYIYLTGFGVEKRLLLAISKNIKEVFGFDIRFCLLNFPPSCGYDMKRGQYRAGDLLNYLSSICYPDMLRLVAVFSSDMFEEGYRFVFGTAQLGGRYAVVSTYRLTNVDERVFFERVFKEVNHELGHTFGLLHCKDELCVMNFSNTLAEVDTKSRFFCKKCKQIISFANHV